MLTTASACATLNGARPLEPGQHEIGATLGGPFFEFAGAAIPAPNIVLEGRSGLVRLVDRPLDINYGTNLTAFPFGIIQLHVGTSWLLVHQDDTIPAVSWTQRFWFATNALGSGYKSGDDIIDAWGAWQLEFTASWEFDHQLLYLSLAQYLDFGNPELTLTPAIGAQFDFFEPGGVRLQVELRWYAVNQPVELTTLSWWPGGAGAFGVSVGVSHAFW